MASRSTAPSSQQQVLPPPSDSRLIEDSHQGSSSAAALRSFEQYRKFVARRNAPVAQMKYSPFTKTETPSRYEDFNVDATASASSTNPTTPTSTFSASSGSSYSHHAANSHHQLHSFPSSAASSRATSPVHGAHAVSHERTHTSLAPTTQLEPSVLHVKEGSAAWMLELPDWNKHNGSSTQTSPKGGDVTKRRGSLTSRSGTGGGGLSRKNSDTNLEKLGNVLNTGSRRSSWHNQRHEQSSQILAAVHVPHATHRTTLSQEKQLFSSGESTLLKDTTQSKNEKRHTNVPYPYLHAHAHDASRLSGKKDLRDSRTKRFSTMPTFEGSKTRGNTDAAAATAFPKSNPIARRGSVSNVSSGNPNANVLGSNDKRQSTFRSRSQSLPCDSLFLAYSNCALPAVMAGALANMPIPAQPAIPVSVARRYSILSHADEHSQLASHDTSQPNTPNSRSLSESYNSVVSSGGYDGLGARSYEDDEVVNVDPEDVAGIDTSSTLDVSHIRDAPFSLEEGDEEAEELSDEKEAEGDENESKVPFQTSGQSTSEQVADVPPQAIRVNRRMSIDKHKASSVQATPVVSPVEPSNGHTAPIATMATPASSPATTTDRLNFGGHKSAFPTFARDDLYESSPDFTPVTSPTNLSHVSFKQTLLTRRMSELVAKDIQKKLRILKKHMQHDDPVASNSNHANQ